jgi:hypothetical protein
MSYLIKEWLQEKFIDLIEWSIRKVFRYKDRILSNRLRSIAELYDPE